ncbi:response regulator transcription factor [Gracilibacillus alcaliphilus]|uniref:response regulator transcription factor n=1 Tax=Gracilibacillus alcaliphilus TaxID=1401441 RepID=UPI00195D9768|nr:response regulator [Gracilibacillus alcaliphilus]MBM7675561.1 two-component system response regulator YesN [Gracilibacillus alcaliphilus]
MNVLIVDDDRFVISALQQKMKWDRLGIRNVYPAYNIHQAKEILEEYTIDILVSDIEMPRGSGLELLAWIRDRGYNVQAIFLTNFADFNYAQKAIELQSFEYYLKPIEFDKLELIIKKAVQKAQQSQMTENALKAGHYLQQNKQEIITHFWHNFLYSSNPFTHTELKEQLHSRQLDYSIEDQLLPIFIALFPYRLVDNKEIQTIIDQETDVHSIIKSMIAESFSHIGSLDFLLEITKDEYLVILKQLDLQRSITPVECVNICDQVINHINQQLGCDAQCHLGEIASIIDMPDAVHKLQQTKKEMIEFRNKTIAVRSIKNASPKYKEPNLSALENYLETNNRLSFVNKCYHHLTVTAYDDGVSDYIAASFRLDIEQLIYTHLKKKEILANKLFQKEIHDFLFTQSSRSIDDLLIYLSYLLRVALDYIEFSNSQKSVVQTICEFIDLHYAENITRATMAKIVFLSPDYIAKIFKKETGLPLVQYLINKRVDVAKDLLKNTNLPIHTISDRVGYDNYSYFTKLFKKETGYTPLDYRKWNRTADGK